MGCRNSSLGNTFLYRPRGSEDKINAHPALKRWASVFRAYGARVLPSVSLRGGSTSASLFSVCAILLGYSRCTPASARLARRAAALASNFAGMGSLFRRCVLLRVVGDALGFEHGRWKVVV